MLFVVVTVGDDAGGDGICLSVCEYICACVSQCMPMQVGRKSREREEKGRRDINWQMSCLLVKVRTNFPEDAGSDGTSPPSLFADSTSYFSPHLHFSGQ